ncbi:MAG: protoheme IX farnesyltransferase [Actinomycetota bacterium]|nr:protoheme IX farnesyltransferase [Actinomycetota bacterium]
MVIEKVEEEELVSNVVATIKNYVEVMKPKETILLAFIGICAAIVAGKGFPPSNLLLITAVAVILGSAGCNGLTNYLDREVDALMKRTKHRALPSKRIDPPEKMLPYAIGLLIIALALAWYLHPLCFLSGALGITTAVVGRKRSITHILGGISGSAPILVGYTAISHKLDLTIGLLCLLILSWTPIHVWSLMTAYRDDFLQARVVMFPINRGIETTIRTLLALSILLYATTIGLYFVGKFSMLYLIIANVLGILMFLSNVYLSRRRGERDAWRVYKISAYPYLGLIFLGMCLDLWLQALL